MKDETRLDKRIDVGDEVEAPSTARVVYFPSEAERDLRRWLHRIRREVALAEEELAELRKEIMKGRTVDL
jgi:hypothetical protein